MTSKEAVANGITELSIYEMKSTSPTTEVTRSAIDGVTSATETATVGEEKADVDGEEKLPPKRKRRNLFDITPLDLGASAVGLTDVPLDQRIDDEVGELVTGPGAGGLPPRASEAKRALPKITRENEDKLAQAKRFAMEQSVQHVLDKQKLQQSNDTNMVSSNAQRQRALTLMCRIYIGSLNFTLDEESIRQAFIPFGSIKSIDMQRDPVTKHHKGFSFVEYDLPEGAQLSLEQMNNVLLGGRNIKVGRPSNVPQASPWIEQILEEAQQYARIYVSSIHPDLAEPDISSVFEAFGKVIACELTPDIMTGKHKGFGFIEFDNQQSANDAIVAMNLFDLGGQYLRVGRAITPPKGASGTQTLAPAAAIIAASAISANIQAQETVQQMGVAAINAMNPLLNPLLNPLAALTGSASPMSVAQSSTQSTTTSSRDRHRSSSRDRKRNRSRDRHRNDRSRRDRSRDRDRKDRSHGKSDRDRKDKMDRKDKADKTEKKKNSEVQVQQFDPVPDPIIDRSNDSSLSRAEREREKKRMEILGITPAIANGPEVNIEREENLEISGKDARYMMMQKLTRIMGSSVLVLRNMVDASEVDADLETEVTEECSLFGEVNRVVIYQEKQGEDEDAEVIVKIFAEFRTAAEAEAAQKAFHGRWFGGRGIVADIYDEEKYNAQDFSG